MAAAKQAPPSRLKPQPAIVEQQNMLCLRYGPTLVLSLALCTSLSAQLLKPAPRVSGLAAAESGWVPWRGMRAVRERAVVRFEPGTSPAQRAQLLAAWGATPLRELGPAMAVLDLPGSGPLSATLSRLSSNPWVRSADPDLGIPTVGAPLSPPDDPALPLQWALGPVRAHEAWELEQGDPSVVIAVLDTGFASSHPDLAPKLAWQMDAWDGDVTAEDTDGHGSHCTGVAAAATDNALGIAGASHGCRFAAYRCGEDTLLSSSVVIASLLDAAARGAHVISMSFGMYVDLPSLQSAVQTAADSGCVLVAAAGNDALSGPFYPAAYPEVIGVAASAPNDSRALFSNYGNWVSVAAPGQSIYSTGLGTSYGYRSGTSMACPLVAGQAALLYAHGGGVRSVTLAQAVRDALQDSAAPVTGGWVAHGRVDMAAALEFMEQSASVQIASLSPASADALGRTPDGAPILLNGSGLTLVTAALVGTIPVDVEVLSDTQLSFQPPPAPALGVLPLQLLSASGSSNTVGFNYTIVSPPHLLVPKQQSVGQPLTWTFGAQPLHTAVLLASLSADTLPLGDWPVLASFVVGPATVLDEQGVGTFAASLPANAVGLELFTQVISGPGHFEAATPVASTNIQP